MIGYKLYASYYMIGYKLKVGAFKLDLNTNFRHF